MIVADATNMVLLMVKISITEGQVKWQVQSNGSFTQPMMVTISL